MPDAYGNFKGVGWSQQRSDAWERIFSPREELEAGVAAYKAAVAEARAQRQTEAMDAWRERGELPPPS